jgi:hypothetical protein
VLAGGLGFAAYARIGTDPAGPPRSIGVLPFADLGGDPDDEYLRDGFTEDVLTQLAKASGLHVISRTSIMQYKESPKGIRTIAEELGATHVLEGSAIRTGDSSPGYRCAPVPRSRSPGAATRPDAPAHTRNPVWNGVRPISSRTQPPPPRIAPPSVSGPPPGSFP